MTETTTTEVDLSRVPAELREQLAELLPKVRQVCLAVDELSKGCDRILAQWTDELHPQLAEPGDRDALDDQLDTDLMNAAGLTALADYAMVDVPQRAQCAEIERAMRLLGVDLGVDPRDGEAR